MQDQKPDEPNDSFFGDLRELVLPVSPLLDPENSFVEAPRDDRFHLAQGMNKFAKDAWEVFDPIIGARQSSD